MNLYGTFTIFKKERGTKRAYQRTKSTSMLQKPCNLYKHKTVFSLNTASKFQLHAVQILYTEEVIITTNNK